MQSNHSTLRYFPKKAKHIPIQTFLDKCSNISNSSNLKLHTCPPTSEWITKLQNQFSSVTQLCPTLCDPMSCSMPGLRVHHQLPELTQTHFHRVVIPSNHLILCHPLLLLPPTPPSIRVFSNEATLYMRWPKYWKD